MHPTVTINVSELRFGSLDAAVHRVEGWTFDEMDDDAWSYTEAFTYTDDAGRDWTLVARDNSVAALWIESDLRSYERHDYDEYADNNENDDGDLAEGALTEDEFDALFEVDVNQANANGPMMNWWYECPAVEDDPIRAAVTIRGTSLCVVEVGGNWGLALTGGGMDLTWEIVEAYVALGQLPPVHYARDLPGMAGRGESEHDRLLIAACLRSLRGAAQNIERDIERLIERFGGGS